MNSSLIKPALICLIALSGGVQAECLDVDYSNMEDVIQGGDYTSCTSPELSDMATHLLVGLDATKLIMKDHYWFSPKYRAARERAGVALEHASQIADRIVAQSHILAERAQAQLEILKAAIKELERRR